MLLPMTLATSMAARQGPVPMAGHQICVQVWLTISLLTDALAIAGQVMASFSPSARERERERERSSVFVALGVVWVHELISACSSVNITCLVFVGCCSAFNTVCKTATKEKV